MALSDRIDALINYTGLSVSSFSQYAGFKSPNAIRELRSGRTKRLSDDALDLFLACFPYVRVTEWLAKGEGDMFKPGFDPERDKPDYARELAMRRSGGTVNTNSGWAYGDINQAGRDIVSQPGYDKLLALVEKQSTLLERYQDLLDRSQSQIDELISIIKDRK